MGSCRRCGHVGDDPYECGCIPEPELEVDDLEDVLTDAFKADRWVQPRKAAQLALRTIDDAGFALEPK